MAVHSILAETYFGSTIAEYLLFFAILGAGAVLGRVLRYVYQRRLKTKAEASETEIDDIILYALGRPVTLLGVVGAAAIGQAVLTPVEPIGVALSVTVRILVIVLLAWIAVRMTDGLIRNYIGSYAERTRSKLDDALVPIVSRTTNIAIVSIAGIVILDSVGYNVNAIIASLGIGGLAVAFASRKALADIFGGVHILTAKPFLVNDLVEIEGRAGQVEEITLRTTQMRDFDGRLITFPNSNIAEVAVKNISSEPTRRIKTFIGLTYETSPADMATALDLAEETVNAVEGVDAEQTGAWFWEYGDSSLRIRLDYHIRNLDEWKHIKNSVNRNIQKAFEDAGFEMAFPTRTVHLDGESGPGRIDGPSDGENHDPTDGRQQPG